MSASPPSPLPAHLRPIPVEIPATWTPEQALAVFELLDEIRDKIWSRYGSRFGKSSSQANGNTLSRPLSPRLQSRCKAC